MGRAAALRSSGPPPWRSATIAAFKHTKEIAEKLVISPSTAHSHRSNLMTKLGLSNRCELIKYTRQRGSIQDE